MFQRLRRQGAFLLPLRSPNYRQPVQLCRHPGRSLLGHICHLYAAAARRLWRLVPTFAALLARAVRVWRGIVGLGMSTRFVVEEEHAGGESEGYQGANDVPHDAHDEYEVKNKNEVMRHDVFFIAFSLDVYTANETALYLLG